ncbi:MAG: M24 family metallopeptidase [bacterium]
MNFPRIQDYLKQAEIDGWLLADFHGRNSVAVAFLGLSGLVTRRSFYFIPREGTPTGLVHAVEKDKFDGLPGEIKAYSGYRELERELAAALSNCTRVAMEYSPKGRLPYIGLVDAGTVELIRNLGVEIVSSADLVASFQARLSDEQIAAHYDAAEKVSQVKDSAFAHIAMALTESKSVTEYDVTRFILDQFEQLGMTTDHPPICAIDAHAGNPHYEPQADKSATIKRGQLILIDLWAKVNTSNGVYADITWMAYAGHQNEIPQRYVDIFAIVMAARDRAVAFLRDNLSRDPVRGAQVDDACRAIIEKAGFGDSFVHRTGHSITSEGHGAGPNIDNLETEDKRLLQPGHLFSIEPGIYLSDCGFRSEINVLVTEDGPEVTTQPVQTEILPLF